MHSFNLLPLAQGWGIVRGNLKEECEAALCSQGNSSAAPQAGVGSAAEQGDVSSAGGSGQVWGLGAVLRAAWTGWSQADSPCLSWDCAWLAWQCGAAADLCWGSWCILQFCVVQIMAPASTCATLWKEMLCAPAWLGTHSWLMGFPVKVSALGSPQSHG